MSETHDGEPEGIWARSTAPQSHYSMRAVWIGFAILAVGLLLTFGLGFVLA